MINVGVQIPCFNEEEDIEKTIDSILEASREWPQDYKLTILVIDDGSTDATSQILRKRVADDQIHLLELHRNMGLAASFQRGIEWHLRNGADIIVNTDADHQYDSSCILSIIQPIKLSQTDICIGDRQISELDEFSGSKKFLQNIGSRVVSKLSHTPLVDSTSGFRAYSRSAAKMLTVNSKFSYTLETIFLASQMRLRIMSIPVKKNIVRRPSRLFKGNASYVRKSLLIMLRCLFDFYPIKILLPISILLSIFGGLSFLPFIIGYVHHDGTAHIQSIIVGSLLILASIQVLILALVAEAISRQRNSVHRVLSRVDFKPDLREESDFY